MTLLTDQNYLAAVKALRAGGRAKRADWYTWLECRSDGTFHFILPNKVLNDLRKEGEGSQYYPNPIDKREEDWEIKEAA